MMGEYEAGKSGALRERDDADAFRKMGELVMKEPPRWVGSRETSV